MFFLVRGDTMLYPYSPTFCSSLKLQDYTNIDAHFYFLDEEPGLVTGRMLTATGSCFLHEGGVHQWQLYLHPGSHINISVCAKKVPIKQNSSIVPLNSDTLSFYLLKANDNWKHCDNRSDCGYTPVNITSSCEKSSETKIHSITGSGSDTYYFIVYNRNEYEVEVHISLSMNRTEYHFDKRKIPCF